MDKLDHLGWVASSTLDVGDTVFEIRSTSEEFSAWIDDVFSAYLTDEEAGAYLSVVAPKVDASKPRSVREFNLLYKGTGEIVRTLHLPTVARVLMSEIEMFLYLDRDDAIYSSVVPISANGATAIVPEGLVNALAGMGRKLKRAGITLPAARAVAIEPTTGRVLPPPRLLDLPADALERLGDLGSGNGNPDRATIDGPVSPTVVLTSQYAGGEMALQPVSRARALQSLTTSVINLEKLGGTALEGLARIVREVPCYAVGGSEDEMLESVKIALRKA